MKNSTRLARIVNQKLGEMNGGTDAYENWIEANMPRDENGDATEPVQANPDSLPEGTSYFGDAQPTRARLLMGEAVEHLQGQQKAVYMLTMREDHSIAQAAKKLGISKGTAATYRERALKFIQQYCARHTTW